MKKSSQGSSGSSREKVLRRLKIRCTAGNCPEELKLCYFSDKTIEINNVNIGTQTSAEVNKIVFFLLHPSPKSKKKPN